MAEQKPYAVIDIGSNSVRLVVYRHFSRAPVQSFNEKAMCELGRGVARNGLLERAAIDQTLKALARFKAVASAMDVTALDAFATAAVRDACNGKTFLAKARDVLGQEVTLLSGVDEASAAVAGVRCGFFAPQGLVADMGGGSLEIGLTGHTTDAQTSLPLGALSLAEAAGGSIERAKSLVTEQLSELDWLNHAKDQTLYAVGGSWRAIARAHMTAADWPLKVAHHYQLTADQARAFLDQVIQEAKSGDINLPGAPRKRQASLGFAAVTLRALLHKSGAASVAFSATGVREGRLFLALDARGQNKDPLIHAAQGWGRIANREAGLGAALAGLTQTIHAGETPAQKRLRVAACHVSDISWRDHPDNRGHLAFSRLVQFPFVAINHLERIALALAVHYRYGGVRSNEHAQPMINKLSTEQQQWAETQGRAMQLAYRFSGGVTASIKQASLTFDADRLELTCPGDTVMGQSDKVAQRLRSLQQVLGASEAIIVH